MKTKTQSIISIILALALVAGCFAAMPQTNAIENSNQDFTGTPVDVVAPESVLVGEEAQISLTVTNIANRGLPQVSIWVNDEQVAFYDSIAKGKSVEYVIDVETDEAGVQIFDIIVWTRLGNKNFQAQLYADATTVEVVEPVPEPKTTEAWIADITDAITDAITTTGCSDITGLIVSSQGSTTITIKIDDIDYYFQGGGGLTSGKKATIEGTEYEISIQGRGNPPVYTWQVILA